MFVAQAAPTPQGQPQRSLPKTNRFRLSSDRSSGTNDRPNGHGPRATLVVQSTMNRALRHGALVEFTAGGGQLRSCSGLTDTSGQLKHERRSRRHGRLDINSPPARSPRRRSRLTSNRRKLHWDIRTARISARQQILRALPQFRFFRRARLQLRQSRIKPHPFAKATRSTR